MEMEDLFAKNSATEFEKRNIVKTLEGLKKHQNHNGVQFDGLKRLSTLTADFSDCENPEKIMVECIEVLKLTQF